MNKILKALRAMLTRKPKPIEKPCAHCKRKAEPGFRATLILWPDFVSGLPRFCVRVTIGNRVCQDCRSKVTPTKLMTGPILAQALAAFIRKGFTSISASLATVEWEEIP